MLAELSINDLTTVLSQTLPKYLARPGDGGEFKMISEAATKDVVAGRLYRRVRKTIEGGYEIKHPIRFSAMSGARWAGPLTRVTPARPKPAEFIRVPKRFLVTGWYKDMIEVNLNRGPKEVLVDLMKDAEAQVAEDMIESLEDVFFEPDGNWQHDDTAGEAEYLRPFGLKYWATIDGNHIAQAGHTTASTAKNVAGINPVSQPLWKNNYITPVASSDDIGVITNVVELRGGLDRMFELMRFDNVKDWGVMADKATMSPTVDPDSEATLRDWMILVDAKTTIAFREANFAREDNVTRDQSRKRPVHRGVELFSTSKLGIDATYGYGFNSSGDALWEDRTSVDSDYASGQWKGYGECVVVNTKYFHMTGEKGLMPYVRPTYMPEQMFGWESDVLFSLQTLCTSRRRGLGYIGPFNTNLELFAD